MVASQQRHVCWVAGLEQQQKREHLKAVAAPVHKVPHKDVAGAGHLTTSLKQPQQVMELPVDVTTYLQQHQHCMHSRQVCYTAGRCIRDSAYAASRQQQHADGSHLGVAGV